MTIDIEWLKLAWTVGSGIIALLAAIGLLWLRSRFVEKEEFNGHARRVDDSIKAHDSRLTVVEQELIHLPSKRDLEPLREEIASLSREISELRGEQKAQNTLLASIHDHLLNQS